MGRGHAHKTPANLCERVFTVSDVVDAVQVLLAFLVIHVLTFGLYYLYGVMAEEDLAGRPAEEPWLELNYRLCNDRGVRNHPVPTVNEAAITHIWGQRLNASPVDP